MSHSFTLAARVSILIDFISPFHRFVYIIECAWDAHITFAGRTHFLFPLLEIDFIRHAGYVHLLQFAK